MLAGEDDFCLVGEINLDYLVAEPEHDGVLGFHPFLDVAVVGRVLKLVLVIVGQVVFKVVQEGDLFLQFPLSRVVTHLVGTYGVCLFA